MKARVQIYIRNIEQHIQPKSATEQNSQAVSCPSIATLKLWVEKIDYLVRELPVTTIRYWGI